MKKDLNYLDGFMCDKTDNIENYINAKARLNRIFELIQRYSAMYSYEINPNMRHGLEKDFSNVFEACLETAKKLDLITDDRNVRTDHEIFYIIHDGKIFRGFKGKAYNELRLVDNYEKNYVFDSIEVVGFADYNIQRLGGEI